MVLYQLLEVNKCSPAGEGHLERPSHYYSQTLFTFQVWGTGGYEYAVGLYYSK